MKNQKIKLSLLTALIGISVMFSISGCEDNDSIK